METRIFEELERRGHEGLFFAADPDVHDPFYLPADHQHRR